MGRWSGWCVRGWLHAHPLEIASKVRHIHRHRLCINVVKGVELEAEKTPHPAGNKFSFVCRV